MALTAASYQAKVNEFQELENTLQTLAQKKSTLEGQLQENKMVKEEFDNLEADGAIFKLIGPVLVKQEASEARDNVQKRLSYLQAEVTAIEKQFTQTSSKQKALKEKIINFQNQQRKLQMEAIAKQKQQQALLQQAQMQKQQQEQQQQQSEKQKTKK